MDVLSLLVYTWFVYAILFGALQGSVFSQKGQDQDGAGWETTFFQKSICLFVKTQFSNQFFCVCDFILPKVDLSWIMDRNRVALLLSCMFSNLNFGHVQT